ncbi:MAG: glycoside hydrolase family 18 protein [Chitinophagaceae bacterium]|nr:glycoside hydrolase family 18 protein [Chitinophagaceae bacterium]
MKYVFKFFVAVFFILNFSNSHAQRKKLRVIAYYAGPAQRIDSFEIGKLTDLIYCFGHLKGDSFNILRPLGYETIQKMVGWKQKNPGLKVILSLGGWGGCQTCSEVFSTQDGRSGFAHSVKDVLTETSADGIDLDWEYPVIEGFPGHSHKPEDKENFTSLLKTLRDSLGKKHLITFAAGGFQKYLDSAIDWKQVVKYVNYINLMTYDLVSGYSTITGHHTALYSANPQMESTDRAVEFLLKAGVPSRKIVIGAAFYGRIWANVPDTNHGLYQPGTFQRMIGFSQIDSLFKTNSGYTQYWDPVVKAPYAYNPAEKLFMTYDDRRSMEIKTEYAIKKKLAGIMFWQLGNDDERGGLLDAIWKVKEGMVKPK